MGTGLFLKGGFKSLGESGWEGVWSNIFFDRDVSHEAPQGERFPLPALKEFAKWANEDPEHNMPVLEFWHLDNVQIGQTKQIEVIGPYIWASGTWTDNEFGQKAKTYFSSEEASEVDWAMSHGYKYRLTDYVDGEIRQFRTRELSVLPVEWAANPLTQFSEDNKMTSLRESLVAGLAKALGVDGEAAEKIITEGVSRKELGAGEAEGVKEAEATDVTQTTPGDSDEDEDEEVGDDELVEALVNTLTSAAEQGKAIADIAAAVKSLAADFATFKAEYGAEVKALKSEADARKQLLPKAMLDALEKRQKAAAAGSTAAVPAEELKQDLQKQVGVLTGQKTFDEDPVGWFEQQAGMGPSSPQL